jgi:hypothetical protein
MADEITNAISDVAQAPLEIEDDAGRIKEQPIPDLITADQYTRAIAVSESLASRSPRGSPWRCLRPGTVVPPGSI